MKKEKPPIAILCWEEGHVPRGLVQLESLVGNSTNPDSYTFPVRFHRIKGANIETVLENPSPLVLERMIAESRQLISEGVRAISTSCGFNAIFQEELSEALSVPVCTSALLLVPIVQRALSASAGIGIITAKKTALKREHLKAAGINNINNLYIFGMEECSEWNKIFVAPESDIDLKKIAAEVLGTAERSKREHPEIGAFVLECTDLPPFSPLIRKKMALPVYDFISMLYFVADSIGVTAFRDNYF